MVTNTTYRIELTGEAATAADRDTLGGAAHLPIGMEHPRCKLCGERMALFLQFDIRAEFGVSLKPGSHLMAFMCPQHNDAPILADVFSEMPLPVAYWEQDMGHYAVLISTPGEGEAPSAAVRHSEIDRYIAPQKLRLVRAEETVETSEGISTGSQDFKVGGVPYWINFTCEPVCSCGGRLRFVCQIPDNFGFPKAPGAPVQPNSFSQRDYCYLLGNFVYLLACDRQCDVRATIAVCDN